LQGATGTELAEHGYARHAAQEKKLRPYQEKNRLPMLLKMRAG
jgi:hypothetical protein